MNLKISITAIFAVLTICSCAVNKTDTTEPIKNQSGGIKPANFVGKEFSRVRKPNEKPNSNPELSNPGFINFKTADKASYLPGGDILFSASYKILGNTIILDINQLMEKKEFTIIDGKTLKDKDGEIYKAR